ncbi:hypothetical protein [Methylovulum psychrotolerans]|uniref:hypothetical protein n=1 Tax=Methylovulum psychrotolerans TaxID=1704499 RepID=UPI002011EDBA|nr:hypothetical protein [Methylovulum psychrotolerans]
MTSPWRSSTKNVGGTAGVYLIETDFANTPRYLRRLSGNTSTPPRLAMAVRPLRRRAGQ